MSGVEGGAGVVPTLAGGAEPVVPEAWKPLSALYTAAAKDVGGAFQTGRYRKNPWNIVEMEGWVAMSPSNCFTLPVGYRPVAQQRFMGHGGGAGIALNVYPTGECSASAGENMS